MTFIVAACLFVTLNGQPIGCTTEAVLYYPVEREVRVGALRVGPGTQPYPGLEYLPTERTVRITGREKPIFANGLE